MIRRYQIDGKHLQETLLHEVQCSDVTWASSLPRCSWTMNQLINADSSFGFKAGWQPQISRSSFPGGIVLWGSCGVILSTRHKRSQGFYIDRQLSHWKNTLNTSHVMDDNSRLSTSNNQQEAAVGILAVGYSYSLPSFYRIGQWQIRVMNEHCWFHDGKYFLLNHPQYHVVVTSYHDQLSWCLTWFLRTSSTPNSSSKKKSIKWMNSPR